MQKAGARHCHSRFPHSPPPCWGLVWMASGGSRVLQMWTPARRGRQHIIWSILPENWMKMKNSREVKHTSPAPPICAELYISQTGLVQWWIILTSAFFFSIKNYHIFIPPDTLCIQCTQSQHVVNTWRLPHVRQANHIHIPPFKIHKK